MSFRKCGVNFSLSRLTIFLLTFSLYVGEKGLHREKRYLLYFPNGGTFKLVIGFATPIPLGLKQSMAWGWNFQFQYSLPQTTNNTRVYPPIISRSREKRQSFTSDRSLVYSGIEGALKSRGLEGRSCLLRAICENAMDTLYHEANGLYGHLLHIVLTPDYGDEEAPEDLDPVYLEAKKAGQFGVECASLYQECQDTGLSLLDLISVKDY